MYLLHAACVKVDRNAYSVVEDKSEDKRPSASYRRREENNFKTDQSFLFSNCCTRELLQKDIKIYIKTALTCFGSITIIRERII